MLPEHIAELAENPELIHSRYSEARQRRAMRRLNNDVRTTPTTEDLNTLPMPPVRVEYLENIERLGLNEHGEGL